MTGIPRRQLIAVLLFAPLAAVLAGVWALFVSTPKASDSALLIFVYVLWSLPAYIVGSLVTVFAYLGTSSRGRGRKLQVFAIHLVAGLAIGAVLAHRSSTAKLVWVVGIMGAVSGAIAALAIPVAADLVPDPERRLPE